MAVGELPFLRIPLFFLALQAHDLLHINIDALITKRRKRWYDVYTYFSYRFMGIMSPVVPTI